MRRRTSARQRSRAVTELAGYIFVTFRVCALPASIRESTDAVVMVTRESDPDEASVLLGLCRPCAGLSPHVFGDLQITEAALLPGAEEAHGQLQRFRLAARLTAHVRHREKYVDMPVTESQAFVFTVDHQAVARARTLKEFTGLIARTPAERLVGHVMRHDFSRWIQDVFRDRPLAAFVHSVEDRVEAGEDVRDIADTIAQAIQGRYETVTEPSRDGLPRAADADPAAH